LATLLRLLYSDLRSCYIWGRQWKHLAIKRVRRYSHKLARQRHYVVESSPVDIDTKSIKPINFSPQNRSYRKYLSITFSIELTTYFAMVSVICNLSSVFFLRVGKNQVEFSDKADLVIPSNIGCGPTSTNNKACFLFTISFCKFFTPSCHCTAPLM
jgi:hypothetical protein